jgi:hypothetical protein
MRKIAVALAISGFAISASAEAHFDILTPEPADSATDGGKGPPPCGPVADTNVITPAQGGHPLTLALSETVFHVGFYRVALALNAPSELPPDNVVKDKQGNVLAPDSIALSDTAEYETTPIFPVLADHLFAHDTPDQSQFQADITLPNVTCDKCTLQVIEFMSNSNSNVGGGYFYHHCATLKITADPALPAFTPPVSGGGAPNGGAAGAASGGAPNGGGAGAAGGAPNGGAVSIADGGAAGAPRSGMTSDSSGCSLRPARRDFSSLWFGLLSFVALTAARRRRSTRFEKP